MLQTHTVLNKTPLYIAQTTTFQPVKENEED